MIRITIDEATSPGMLVNVDLEWASTSTDQTGPTDAELVALAEAILASDAVQNRGQWNGTPSLTSVAKDEQRGLYPAP